MGFINCKDCCDYKAVKKYGMKFCNLHSHVVPDPANDGCTFGRRKVMAPKEKLALALLHCVELNCGECPLGPSSDGCDDEVVQLAHELGVEL